MRVRSPTKSTPKPPRVAAHRLVSWLAAGLVACGLATACSTPAGPEAAFERLLVAVAARDPRLLYLALDTESRWALDSVWTYQREIAKLVESRFPEPARGRELARVAPAVAAGHPDQFLGRQTLLGDPLARLPAPEALGRLERVERAADGTARVVTTTGQVLPFAPGRDGQWGWSGLQAELVRWRDAAANDWKRLDEDAARR